MFSMAEFLAFHVQNAKLRGLLWYLSSKKDFLSSHKTDRCSIGRRQRRRRHMNIEIGFLFPIGVHKCVYYSQMVS